MLVIRLQNFAKLFCKVPYLICIITYTVLQDRGGHVTTVTQPFSLDKEPASVALFESFVLQANLPTGVSNCLFQKHLCTLNMSSVVKAAISVAMVIAYWTTTTCQVARKRCIHVNNQLYSLILIMCRIIK